MNLKAQLTALKTQSSDLTLAERAELSCRLAKQFEKAGDYDDASEALAEFWPERDETPNTQGLDRAAAAEIFLRVGALAGWLGSSRQAEGSQEMAKNLITKSIELFDELGQSERVAEARGDIALCYWREGGYDEARINLDNALTLVQDTNPSLKVTLLIRAGIVEVWSQRLTEASQFYNKAALLLDETDDHALKGAFHDELAVLFTKLSEGLNSKGYMDRALIEYSAASFHFEQAGNVRYQARVENNLGYLFFTVGRFKEAYFHLDRARGLFLEIRDAGAAAGVDETRARTLIAEGHNVEAERMARSAVRTLRKGGEQAVLAEALTTHAIALARLGNDARARSLFEEAIDVAQTAGDLEGAGKAKLSIVEELGEKLSIEELTSIYCSAIDLLKGSQDPSTAKRLISCAKKLFEVVKRLELKPEPELQEHTWEGFSFKQHVHAGEREVIERALRDARGSVTKAARLLGFRHHQSLISLINSRHKELLKTRSMVRKRRRHIFSAPKRAKKKTAEAGAKPDASQISILHVEDHKQVANLIADILGSEGIAVKTCVNGMTALKWLAGDARYDVVIVDNDLPGLNGLELVRRARKITHRRRTPIIMLSGDDIEKEAWRAGADEFLRKPEAVDKVSSTIARLLEEQKERKD